MSQFSITINTDNPAVIAAIAKAVKNCPPEGFVSVDAGVMPEVQVHTTKENAEAAMAAVTAAPEAKVELAEPVVKEEAKDGIDYDERRARLRKLLLKVGQEKLESVGEATKLALKIAGIKDGKELPTCEKFDEVVTHFEGLLNG